MKKVYPCIWFAGNGLEAFAYYKTIFGKNLKEVSNNNIVLIIELFDERIMLLNASHSFVFNESFSITIECESQEEIDHYWGELSKDGFEQQCGWVKDKYGLSWQIVPSVLKELMSNSTSSDLVMKELLSMKKIDIQKLTQVS